VTRARPANPTGKEKATRAAKPRAIPAQAAFSFLKDTKGTVTWTLRDVSQILKIERHSAEEVVTLLEAQGYAKRDDTAGEWMTTPAGESVSGAKAPRFSRASVVEAVEAIKERIRQVNADSKAAFRITSAVAFGDFLLSDRPRTQAADVGISLTRKGQSQNEESKQKSATEAREEMEFLRGIRGTSALVQLKPYADWMSDRSNLKLL
jgi:hypothetical protein